MSSSEAANIPKVSKRVEKELHQTKVIIRRLPPDFTEEKLREKLSSLPPHSYFYFAPGDPTLGPHGCSRAYISFTDESLMLPFRDQFDGYVFETEKGQKYRSIIEFAPYQGIPKKSKRKPDARCGTIEQDADYQAFLQAYEAKPEPLPSVDLITYIGDIGASKKSDVQVTPLIEYLEKRRSSRSSKGGKNKVFVVEPRKKRKGDSSKSKGAKSSSKGGGNESESVSKWSKSRAEGGGKRGREKDENWSEREGLKSASTTKLAEHEKQNSASTYVEDLTGSRMGSVTGWGNGQTDGKQASKQEGGGDPWPDLSDITTMKVENQTSFEQYDKEKVSQPPEKKRGHEKRHGYREERRGRRGGYQPEGGNDGSLDEKKFQQIRNKDRPDKAIYNPRSRGQHGDKSSPRLSSSTDYSKSKRDYSSKYDDGGGYRLKRDGDRLDDQPKENEHGSHYFGDEYSKKDRRDREYERRRGRGQYGGGRGRGYSRDFQYDATSSRPKSSSYQDK